VPWSIWLSCSSVICFFQSIIMTERTFMSQWGYAYSILRTHFFPVLDKSTMLVQVYGEYQMKEFLVISHRPTIFIESKINLEYIPLLNNLLEWSHPIYTINRAIHSTEIDKSRTKAHIFELKISCLLSSFLILAAASSTERT